MEASIVPGSPKGSTATPYKLDIDQTLKASKALLRHVQQETKRLQAQSTTRNLLQASTSDSESEDALSDDQPIWLNLTTKQHIVDKNRLKPSKVAVPHSLNKSSDLSICLITADPQRAVKNAVADSSFPKTLSSRITTIIGFSKLKARYQTFESRRQLFNEHDIFLADDRIITRLTGTLGKVFYKGTTKRPIPISIALIDKVDGKRVKVDSKEKKKTSKEHQHAAIASPVIVAKEIERALTAVPVSLRPGVSVAVRVGRASFTPSQLAENISVVVGFIVDKHVVKGWRNVKSIHIKSSSSIAIPIWLAEDMWTGEDDIIEDVAEDPQKSIEGQSEKSNKRKRKPNSDTGPQAGLRKKTKVDEEKMKLRDDDMAANEARKAKLAQQKKVAFAEAVASA